MTAFIYPEWDTELRKIEFQARSIWRAADRCKRTRVAIQAGGGVGVWPMELGEKFLQVYTFEPDGDNFNCLMQNIAPQLRKIVAFNAALWDGNGQGRIERTPSEKTNAGAGYIVEDPAGDVRLRHLGYYLQPGVEIDFVQLDVEGAEFRALRGMEHWLRRDKPIVVIEEKDLGLGHDVLAARRYLGSLGYKPFGKSARDVFFSC